MQKINKITQEKYEELYNSGVIDRVCPEPGYGYTINRTLCSLLATTKIARCFKFPSPGYGEASYYIYDHPYEYTINLDKIVDRKKGDIKFLKINFTSLHNTIDHFKEDIKRDYVDQSFIMFVANPRLYAYSYEPENPHFAGSYLSIAHVGKFYYDYGLRKTWDTIYKLNEYLIEETGEPLFFKF